MQKRDWVLSEVGESFFFSKPAKSQPPFFTNISPPVKIPGFFLIYVKEEIPPCSRLIMRAKQFRPGRVFLEEWNWKRLWKQYLCIY